MAEAPQFGETLNRKGTLNIVKKIFRLTENNSLNGLRQLLKSLQPEYCMVILNYTIESFSLHFSTITRNRQKISKTLRKSSKLQQMYEAWKKYHHPHHTAILNRSRYSKVIRESLLNINDYINMPCTPLIFAVHCGKIEYVRLMIEFGANINMPNSLGCTPLMMSLWNIDIFRYLVDIKANLNQRDIYGNTALHKSVSWNRGRIIKALIIAGADVRIENNEGLTPHMMAALRNDDMIYYFRGTASYTTLEKAEAFEVANACLVSKGYPTIDYWARSLRIRRQGPPKTSPFTPQEILDFAREFTTLEELKLIENNQLDLSIQGVLVIERIFGQKNMMYLQIVVKTALIAKIKKEIAKFQALMKYIDNYCQFVPPSIVAKCAATFMSGFHKFTADGDTERLFENGGFTILNITARAVVEMWHMIKDHRSKTPIHYHVLLNVCLEMISKIKPQNVPQQYLPQFYETVLNLVKADPRLQDRQSLLHHSIKGFTELPYGTIEFLRLLLECNANVNSKDYHNRTPLLYALKYAPDNIHEIVELLTAYGCHLPDCRKCGWFSAADFSRWKNLEIPRSIRSLQCQAASAVLNNQIKYKWLVPRNVEDFLNFHK